MIINHAHRFIFIHVPKSAGSTVTSLLSKMTTYRDQEIGSTPHAAALLAYYSTRFGLRKHSAAEEVVKIVGHDIWQEYFTFGFVRNPYWRLVSAFNFLKSWNGTPEKFRTILQQYPSVNEFLLSDTWTTLPGPDHLFCPQALWLTFGKEHPRLAVDFVGRTEHMASDLASIRRRLHLPAVTNPPPEKNKSPAYEPPEGWPAEVVRRVQSHYAIDFEMFGYDRDPPS